MATVHREPNQVKWIGVRPGHNGIEILESCEAAGATVNIYQVPADKLLLLFGWSFNLSATAPGVGDLSIWTAVPARHKYLSRGSAPTNAACYDSRDLVVPIEVAAGFWIRATSGAATIGARAVINGILIDA